MSHNPADFTLPAAPFPDVVDADLPDFADFGVPGYVDALFNCADTGFGPDFIMLDQSPEVQTQSAQIESVPAMNFDFDTYLNETMGDVDMDDETVFAPPIHMMGDGYSTIYTTERNSLYDDPTPANDGVSLLLQAPLASPTAGPMSVEARDWVCMNDPSLIPFMMPELANLAVNLWPVPVAGPGPVDFDVPTVFDPSGFPPIPIPLSAGKVDGSALAAAPFEPIVFDDLYGLSPSGFIEAAQGAPSAAPEPLLTDAEIADLLASPLTIHPLVNSQLAPLPVVGGRLEPIVEEDEGDLSSPLSAVSSGTLERIRKSLPAGAFELPQLDPKKPWVGKNYTTEGKSSRSKKINSFNAEVVYTKPEAQAPPLGKSWTSSAGTIFEYTEHGELMASTLSTEEMREFLYEHPRTKNCKLRLWVQVSPADSAKRYPCEDSSSCRFADCPMQELGYKGTITTGHLRVAFDEKWCKYGEDSDPFVVAGYVHLYCLERFLDLPDICRLDHLKVKVDDRELEKEPNGKWAAALGASEPRIAQVVRNFITAAEGGPAEFADHYPFYPIHNPAMNGFPKSHVDTLNHAVQEARHAKENRKGGAKHAASNLATTLGDLEEFLKHKGNKSKLHLRVIDEADKAERRKRKRADDDPSAAKKVRLDVPSPAM